MDFSLAQEERRDSSVSNMTEVDPNGWYLDNAFSIGKTPLVRLNRSVGEVGATVLAKIESRNPAASVKCRLGAALVWDAEQRGVLRPGMEIVEPTSGNTGIALAVKY